MKTATTTAAATSAKSSTTTTATAPISYSELDSMLTAALKAQDRLNALKEKVTHLQGLRVSTQQELVEEQAKMQEHVKGTMDWKKAQAQVNHVEVKVNGVSKVFAAVEKQMHEQLLIVNQYKAAKQRYVLQNGGGENDVPTTITASSQQQQQQQHKHNRANKKCKKAKASSGTGSSHHHSARKPRSKPLAEWAKKDALMRHLDKQNELSKVRFFVCVFVRSC